MSPAPSSSTTAAGVPVTQCLATRALTSVPLVCRALTLSPSAATVSTKLPLSPLRYRRCQCRWYVTVWRSWKLQRKKYFGSDGCSLPQVWAGGKSEWQSYAMLPVMSPFPARAIDSTLRLSAFLGRTLVIIKVDPWWVCPTSPFAVSKYSKFEENTFRFKLGPCYKWWSIYAYFLKFYFNSS